MLLGSNKGMVIVTRVALGAAGEDVVAVRLHARRRNRPSSPPSNTARIGSNQDTMVSINPVDMHEAVCKSRGGERDYTNILLTPRVSISAGEDVVAERLHGGRRNRHPRCSQGLSAGACISAVLVLTP